ncbi:GDSL esterase/lipase [Cinnamomum micranthum f. kanehirae]|uniref:GDSL esterase/lipase n=1 Tax=Cinnamomum micranthum f. kanehirae TaxID=337451 RepID=A0A3S3QEM3_9MAGN|nr:GDSL esterase/lipase [Cinnamomum micranthum f. kanehirae]
MEKFKLFLYVFVVVVLAGAEVQAAVHSHLQKLFVFGDSYADTGNSRKISASSWKPPYGITFPGKPSGRFSDGRVLTDFLAKFQGIRSPIPYKWRKIGPKALRYGMNFAYGGTGVFDTLGGGPNMTTQINMFQKLIQEGVYSMGDLQNSMALVAVSGNDYTTYQARNGTLNDVQAFITSLINQLELDLKHINDIGVKKIAVNSLQPVGCLPLSTGINSYQKCNDTANLVAIYHNTLLQKVVQKINSENKNSKVVILDLYGAFSSVLQSSSKGDHITCPWLYKIDFVVCLSLELEEEKMCSLCKVIYHSIGAAHGLTEPMFNRTSAEFCHDYPSDALVLLGFWLISIKEAIDDSSRTRWKFENPLKPCCMPISSKYQCGSLNSNGTKMYTVCKNPKSAFFWDQVHPTQMGWTAVSSSLKTTLYRTEVQAALHSHLRRLFVFGDSYADTGNMRRISASSWKPPYGITIPGKPSGRSSDGWVLTDFVAKIQGIHTPVPYERRKKHAPKRLRYGMNFAHGGSGVFDTLVSFPNLTTQIHMFQQLIQEGVYSVRDLHNSMALVSVAGNDYTVYGKNGTMKGVIEYISSLINQLELDLKRINDIGVKKIAVNNLQPIGCLPYRTANNSYQNCDDTYNVISIYHNSLLQKVVEKMNRNNKNSIVNPLKPCCKPISSEYQCGSVNANGTKMYTVCETPEFAFFWDQVHPTHMGWTAVTSSLKTTLYSLSF